MVVIPRIYHNPYTKIPCASQIRLDKLTYDQDSQKQPRTIEAYDIFYNTSGHMITEKIAGSK